MYCGSLVCRAYVAFVVQAGERNVMDQRMLEFELWERHAVPCIRVTLAEVRALCCDGLYSFIMQIIASISLPVVSSVSATLLSCGACIVLL